MTVRFVSLLSAAFVGLVVLLTGCGGGTGVDVAEGRYRLYVEGPLRDTLSGPAVVRDLHNGRTGIELGRRDGPGLSLELAMGGRGSRGRPGRYDVVSSSLLQGPSSDSLVGLLAFLSVGDLRYTATQGHISVTDVRDGALAGRVELEMAEQGDTVPGDHTVQVTGVLRATRP